MPSEADRDALLFAAIEQPPGARARFLADTCGVDTALRASIERLLRELDEVDPFLKAGGALEAPFGEDVTADLERDEGLPEGAQIGPYRILEELGRGGMAVVYLAERADGAYTQQVALKVVRRGIDTDDVLTRFRQERQILASLTHPNIARLLDGGVTPDGRPFLAMELVRGEAIDRFCDRKQLDIDARIDLCIAVARAVQHAHSRLTVHRDLKPSNILITEEGEIRLLDFGIAKLLDPTVEDSAPLTRTAARLLTPEYASPEQLRGDAMTTASDIYQLGLLLFELLTGRRAHLLQGLGPAQAERIVCEEDPPRPSAVGVGPASGSGWKHRLRGDLDTIVLTALRKEPERRYGSVEQLAGDLVRYRRGLPIKARRSSLAYRTGKFLRRHRIATAAAASVVVLVTALVTFYSVRLAGERDSARREAATATRVTEFVTGLFRAANPFGTEPPNVTVRELLDRGAERIDVELANEPVVQARLLTLIGGIYQGRNEYQKALPLLERAVAIRRERLGSNHPDVAESLHSLGSALYFTGRYDQAQPALEEALRVREQALGPDHADVGATLNTLGLLSRRRGRFEEARDLLERAVAIRERALGLWHEQTARDLNNLGAVYQSLLDFQSARDRLERALAIHQRNHGPEHPLVAGTLSNLGDVLRQAGDLQGARPLLERAVAISENVLGPNHQDTAIHVNALAGVYAQLHQYDDARRLLERAVDIYGRVLGPQHPNLAFPIENLGHTYRDAGDDQRALVYYERALTLRETAFGPVHVNVAHSLESQGLALVRLAECGRATPILRRALDVFFETSPGDQRRIGRTSSALGGCLTELGRLAEAEPLLLDAVKILRARKGDNAETQLVLRRLVTLYEKWGKPDEADPYRSERTPS